MSVSLDAHSKIPMEDITTLCAFWMVLLPLIPSVGGAERAVATGSVGTLRNRLPCCSYDAILPYECTRTSLYRRSSAYGLIATPESYEKRIYGRDAFTG